jgi:lysine N6-hydroxylase
MNLVAEPMDVVGIGVGPANLSLAALLQPCEGIRSQFFERSAEFHWHPGLMFPSAGLQVHHIKDLVTLADPTSRYSFLAFLSRHKRLYSFVNANFSQVLRREFNEYMRWVCSELPNLAFDCAVDAVTSDGDGFAVHTPQGIWRTRDLVVGTGVRPKVPDCVAPNLGATVWHASQYLFQDRQLAGKRVAIVGGGQTGAEVFLHVVSEAAAPSSVVWLSRRDNFAPLDESPFTNELFTPHYSDYFFGLPRAVRQRVLESQKLASDGVSSCTLEAIYRRLYELKFLSDTGCRPDLRPGRELEAMDRAGSGWRLLARHDHSGALEAVDADIVILATGYEQRLPACLEACQHLIHRDHGELVVHADFSIAWDGPPGSRIYIQNGARRQRGIADPNLSLLAWRSAKIANSIIGWVRYDVELPDAMVSWDAGGGLDLADGHYGALLDSLEDRL